MPALLTAALLATAAGPAASPWDGAWALSASRNTPEMKAQAAADYRFDLQPDGAIRWEIPSLKEVVVGRTDGTPMPIVRGGRDAGLTLAVTAVSPYVLTYQVARAGRPVGEGRMTLIENGAAWVDISCPFGKPQYCGAVVYTRS
jgi:hypothetical protein